MAINPNDLTINFSFRNMLAVPRDIRETLASSGALDQFFNQLSPTQMALLFPKYYKESLPDVVFGGPGTSGFVSKSKGLQGAEQPTYESPAGLGSTTGSGEGRGRSAAGAAPRAATTSTTQKANPPTLQERQIEALKKRGLISSAPAFKGANDRDKLLLDFAKKWNMHPSALAGILKIESGGADLKTDVRGGGGNEYYGVFQLHKGQIAELTQKAGLGRLTPDQYRKLNLEDQLKVMDKYYAKWVGKDFFTGDANKDASKAWALQLAPGHAKRINYDDPNAVISKSNQAASISARKGLVTVGSVRNATVSGGESVLSASMQSTGMATSFNIKKQTRDQLSSEDRQSVVGKRKVSLDFNSSSGKASGVEIIIPDDATQAERAAAQKYVQGVKKFFEDRGYKNYKVRGVRTSSENGRGVAGFFHTEPFFLQDEEALKIIKSDPQGYAQVLSSTLGTIDGVTFIPPHRSDDPGAVGAGINERDFALNTLIPALEGQQVAAAPVEEATATPLDPAKVAIVSQIAPNFEELLPKISNTEAFNKMTDEELKSFGNELAALKTEPTPTQVNQMAETASIVGKQSVSISEDVLKGKVPYISGDDFAVPVYLKPEGSKFDEDVSDMDPRAVEQLKAAAVSAKAAGLSKLVVTGAEATKGHKSHKHGTEFDFKGYDENGKMWTNEQRALTVYGAAASGADRLGFYPGGGVHIGNSGSRADRNDKGRPVSAWGPGGATSGVSSSQFAQGLERDLARYAKGEAPLPGMPAVLSQHLEKRKQAQQSATQTPSTPEQTATQVTPSQPSTSATTEEQPVMSRYQLSESARQYGDKIASMLPEGAKYDSKTGIVTFDGKVTSEDLKKKVPWYVPENLIDEHVKPLAQGDASLDLNEPHMITPLDGTGQQYVAGEAGKESISVTPEGKTTGLRNAGDYVPKPEQNAPMNETQPQAPVIQNIINQSMNDPATHDPKSIAPANWNSILDHSSPSVRMVAASTRFGNMNFNTDRNNTNEYSVYSKA